MSNENRLLLWADDDEDDIYLIKLALPQRDTSFKLLFFSTGLDLLKYIHATADLPDLIVLDYNMPGLDGKSVLQELRKNKRLNSIPIVMMSTCKDIRQICIREGATECFVKPTRFAELKRIITFLTAMMDTGRQTIPTDNSMHV